MFGSSVVIYALFVGPNIFSKCGNLMDLLLLVSELICFVIFVADGRGSLVRTSSSVASLSIIAGASMNLNSG